MYSAQPNDDLEEEYQDLTEKQRAVIDAHAETPDATNRDKADAAADKLGEDETVNESYCSQILNQKYPEVAQYREEIIQNERPQGQMTTEGDPFQGKLQQSQGGYQSIQDRSVQDTQSGQPNTSESAEQEQRKERTERQQPQPVRTQNVQVANAEDGVIVKFDHRYLRELLEDQNEKLPPELHQRLVDIVLERAFAQQAN